MSKRHRHRHNHRPDLREVMEGFEQDWKVERDAVLAEDMFDNVQPIRKVVQAERPGQEEASKELELAKTRIADLEARCRRRWSTWSVVMWLIGTAATFGAIGYIVRVVTG